MFNYQATPQALAGKVILVTGAGDGIGKGGSAVLRQTWRYRYIVR